MKKGGSLTSRLGLMKRLQSSKLRVNSFKSVRVYCVSVSALAQNPIRKDKSRCPA